MKGNGMDDAYQVIGVESSPYTVKVRAVLRYRRLPHTWLCRMPQFYPPLAQVRPLLMPVVRFPDGTHRVDSTPIILSLEELHPGQRSVLPDDPVLALCARIVEDMADEWLTKCLFHYRFTNDADRDFAPRWVMDDAHPGADQESLEKISAEFLARQSDRMALVGVMPENTPVIEASLAHMLDALAPFVALDRFLFGSRPSLADFGLYGQLKTLCVDPTPAAVVRRLAPRVEHWARRVDDLSGVEGEWQDSNQPNAAVEELLRLAGHYYLPFLQANKAALAEKRQSFTVTLPEGSYRQTPFSYQAKCLTALQTAFAALPDASRSAATDLLDKTGCLGYLQAS